MRQARSARFLTVMFSTVCSWAFTASGAAQSWTQIAPAVTPRPRDDAVLVYDPVREELVLFGGDDFNPGNETWVLAGDVWIQRSPSRSPVARSGAYGFWDSARERVVVFGGSGAGQIDRSVIWSWDGSDWSSITLGQNPPERRDAAVAYDSARDRIVLFGGVVDGSPDVSLADTWEFDGSAWVETTPGTSPGDRGGALMGYDPVRHTIVLANGFSQLERLRWDTWLYDGSTWTELPDANAPRGTALEMTWDPTEEKLLIAGRKDAGQLTSWHFDGAVWTEDAASSFNLNGGSEAGLAFDVGRGYALYLHAENQTNDGFRLQGGTWERLLPVPQPSGIDVARGALIFDTTAGEPRLLGDALTSAGFQGWRWDGVMWRLLRFEGSTLPSATGSIAHDQERGVSVAYGGGTLELDGATWTNKTATTAPPASGAMAYDPDRGAMVYFGGSTAFERYSDGTWTWDGTRWEALDLPVSPPPRWRSAMAYDERRQRMVLFGGFEILNGQPRHAFDTWELNTTTWVRSSAEGPANLRDFPCITYDQGRRRVVLWAEQREDEARVWEYDGRTWIGTDPPPIGGIAAIIGYDAAEQRLLLHDEAGRTWARPSGSIPPPDDGVDEADAGPAGGSAGGGAENDGGVSDADGAAGKSDAATSPGTRGHGAGGDSGCALTRPASAAGGSWALVLAIAIWLRRMRFNRSRPSDARHGSAARRSSLHPEPRRRGACPPSSGRRLRP